jgi:vacuolar-type H+-ATPase subunit H
VYFPDRGLFRLDRLGIIRNPVILRNVSSNAGALMSSKDQDLLDKLFEVEKKAEVLVTEAKREADRRIAAAKQKAEAEYSAAYEAAVKEGGARKAAAVEAAIAEYESAVAKYRGSLEATSIDEKSFRAVCEAALAKK